MPLFAISVFLSAFLLFQVQPITGRALLPWFGGTPAVWTTCLVFFQLALLGGYLYSHALIRHLRPRRQAQVHLGLLALAALVLGVTTWRWGAPLLPAPSARPAGALSPVVEAAWLMAASVGLPYFALSTTGPLLQAWFSADPKNAGRTPYRLYALSNLGSLLALLAYPALLEPAFGLRTQGWLWAAGFLLFTVAAGANAWKARALAPPAVPAPGLASSAGARPTWGQYAFWTALAACASLMLVAATNHLGEAVAVAPFLWVMPLALYLLTFVLCFESDRWYRRAAVLPLLAAALLGCAVLLFRVHSADPALLVAAYCLLVFLTSLACHGELARSRPDAQHLTAFYLCLALGGAVGGAAVSLVAPVVFRTSQEIDLALVGAWLAVLVALLRDRTSAAWGRRQALVRGAATAMLFALAYVVYLDLADWSHRHPAESGRSFFGVVSVRPMAPPVDGHFIEHAGIIHGNQFHDDAHRRVAAAYYGPRSGVGQAIEQHPRRLAGQPLRVGVIGLGVGAVAAYGRLGDVFRFYEINPDIVRYARDTRYFTYLSDSAATVEVALGDGRRSMEQELAAGQRGAFDVLVLDAFSGHSMPTHLLTRECFGVYRQMLRDEDSVMGLLMPAQATLEGVLHRVARDLALELAALKSPPDLAPPDYPSVWMFFAPSARALARPEFAPSLRFTHHDDLPRAWTDDYVNLLGVMKWTIE